MTEFNPGDVVKSRSNIPSLVIAYSTYGIVTRRFNFTPAANYKGSQDSIYRASELSLASIEETRILRQEALRAFNLTRRGIPEQVLKLLQNQNDDNTNFSTPRDT